MSDDLFESYGDPNNILERLYRIKVNQIHMIRDRQYIIGDDESNLSYDTFYNTYFSNGMDYSNLNRCYRHQSNVNDMICVYYIPRSTKSLSGAIGTEWMEPIFQQIYVLIQGENPIRHYIFIIETSFTPKVREEINTKFPFVRIEVFMFDEMLFNPTSHYLVPRHELLTSDEVQELSSHVDLNKIPWISIEDPIVKYYGYKVGDIIRIHRMNLVLDTIIDEYITYRMVKNTPLTRQNK